MKVDCARIVVDGRRLCMVKDSCLGCEIDSQTCAIDNLLDETGVLESWKNWDMPNYRERKNGNENKMG